MNTKLQSFRESLQEISTTIEQGAPQIVRPVRSKHFEKGKFAIALNDSAWLHAPTFCDKSITTDLMRTYLYRRLNNYGFEIVVPGFSWHKCEMDMIGVFKDFVVEFEIKVSRGDYSRDFKKMISLGPQQLNKHGMLQAGKWLPNKFYFVCPAKLVDLDHLPGHCGLIAVSTGKDGFPIFTVVKEAPWLHNEKVKPSFYKTMATRIALKYDQLLMKYRFGKKYLYDNASVQAQYNAPQLGQDHTERQDLLSNPEGQTATGRTEAPAEDRTVQPLQGSAAQPGN